MYASLISNPVVYGLLWPTYHKKNYFYFKICLNFIILTFEGWCDLGIVAFMSGFNLTKAHLYVDMV